MAWRIISMGGYCGYCGYGAATAATCHQVAGLPPDIAGVEGLHWKAAPPWNQKLRQTGPDLPKSGGTTEEHGLFVSSMCLDRGGYRGFDSFWSMRGCQNPWKNMFALLYYAAAAGVQRKRKEYQPEEM